MSLKPPTREFRSDPGQAGQLHSLYLAKPTTQGYPLFVADDRNLVPYDEGDVAMAYTYLISLNPWSSAEWKDIAGLELYWGGKPGSVQLDGSVVKLKNATAFETKQTMEGPNAGHTEVVYSFGRRTYRAGVPELRLYLMYKAKEQAVAEGRLKRGWIPLEEADMMNAEGNDFEYVQFYKMECMRDLFKFQEKQPGPSDTGGSGSPKKRKKAGI